MKKLRLVLVGTSAATVVGVVLVALTGSPAVKAATVAAPTNTSPPTITGTPQEGQKLVGHRGEWNGSPTDYNDFWMRCDQDGGSCANISGANDRNGYTLKAVDVGNTIRFKVQAKNADGSTVKTSVPSAVIAAAAKPPAPPATGCPAGNGAVNVSAVSPPARLTIDQTEIAPATVTYSTRSVTMRFRVTACGGRPVQGALVYTTAVPYGQLATVNEQSTGADGWATVDVQTMAGFPASRRQQLLVVFVRARKSGENLLGGISTRRLVSFHVTRG